MTTPYTYLLKHKPTGHLYYGVRWKKGCHPDEFWKTYYTSSKKLVPLYRTIYGDDCWKFEIRRTFKTGKEASRWESKVLRRMKVLDKPDLWLNRTTNTAWLYDNHPRGNLNRKRSLSSRQKQSVTLKRIGYHPIPVCAGANKGMPSSLRGMTYEKIHGLEKAKHLKEIRRKSALCNGSCPPRLIGTEAAQKSARWLWITNGVISKRIQKEEIMPVGFRWGRI